MRYQHFRSLGMFVGSGAVEAGCKAVIGQRLKLSGMHWSQHRRDRHPHPALPASQRPLGRNLAAAAQPVRSSLTRHLTTTRTQTIQARPGYRPGVVSPVLSNIYLHKLDEFVERELIPQYTRGEHRAPNPEYQEVKTRLRSARRHGDRAAARDLRRQLRAFPAGDPMDPGYRRLFYCRYADDHLLGFTGPKAEAEQIKAELARFLRETLALELSPDKTLISHARTQPARFLGYDIIVQHCNTKITGGLRSANGKIALRVPPDVVKAQRARYRCRGKPWHRPRLQNQSGYDIVRIYGAEYLGVVNYYRLAQDVSRLGTLCWTCGARIRDRDGDLLILAGRGLSGGDLVLVRESAQDLLPVDPVPGEVDLR